MSETKVKKKVGRPAKDVNDVLPENWKDLVLRMSDEGKSEVEIRSELCRVGGKFSIQLWYDLEKRNEEFSETLKIGSQLCQAWWERCGREHLYHGKGTVFETGLWTMNMKNRFKWTDKTHNLNMNGSVDDEDFCNEFFGLSSNGRISYNGNGKHNGSVKKKGKTSINKGKMNGLVSHVKGNGKHNGNRVKT